MNRMNISDQSRQTDQSGQSGQTGQTDQSDQSDQSRQSGQSGQLEQSGRDTSLPVDNRSQDTDPSAAGNDPDTAAGNDPDTAAGNDPDTAAGNDPDTAAGNDPDTAAGNDPDASAGKEADATAGNDPYASSRETGKTVPGGSPHPKPVEVTNPTSEEILYDEHGHRYLSSEAINAWRISGAIGSMVYWMIPLGYGTLTMGASGWPVWPAYVLGIVFFAITVLHATVIPWIRWKRWRYHVDQNEIDLRRGLFVVVRTLIPVKRIQHVDTRQGPVYRQFGLASVTVTTAGDTHEIPALSEPVADELRNKISEYARVAREDL